MKVVRLQRGFSIRLSDSEFEALSDLSQRGEGDFEGMTPSDWKTVSPAIKRGLRTVTGQGSWRVEDRRK